MIRNLFLVFLIWIGICNMITAQDTWSNIIKNDTLTEQGHGAYEFGGNLYIVSRTRCQPHAQTCAELRKYDMLGNIIWNVQMPTITPSNQNMISSYKENLIITGRRNWIDDPQRHSFYEIDTAGNILNLTHMNLPYQSNFNYGSIIKGDTLYMYGTGREDVTEEGIDVDALIVTYDLVLDTFSYEYFDYGHDFVDIWDMRAIEDGSILFYSRHRRQEYIYDSLDWVVERLWPDGHRTTTYNKPYNSEGGVNVPQMEYLGDGLIVLLFPNENPTIFTYPNIRIINLEGEVVAEQNYDFINPNSFRNTVDIRRTNDGAILLCGSYNDKQLSDDELPSSSNAYVSKMSRDGTIEWLRHFRIEDENTENPIVSGFSTVLSLSDNSIVAVGTIQSSPSDLYIVKLDEHGCFAPDDCGSGVVTNVEEVIVEDIRSDYKIYPNPAEKEQPLRIEVENAMNINGSMYVQIVDTHGKKVIEDKVDIRNVDIDISSLVSGVYFVSITDHYGNILGIEKLVVL